MWIMQLMTMKIPCNTEDITEHHQSHKRNQEHRKNNYIIEMVKDKEPEGFRELIDLVESCKAQDLHSLCVCVQNGSLDVIVDGIGA